MILTSEALLSALVLIAVVVLLFTAYPDTGILHRLELHDSITVAMETGAPLDVTASCPVERYFLFKDGELRQVCTST